MTNTCPAGHQSDTTDYCSVCGALIEDLGDAASVDPESVDPESVDVDAVDVSADAPDPSTATQRRAPKPPPGEPCPECKTPRMPEDRYCEVCGHDIGAYQADDGPAYFTILLIGHLIVAPMLCLSFILTWPVWLVLSVTMPVLAASVLLVLPRVKGAFIGFQWATRATAAP